MSAWRTLKGASAAELRPAHTLLNGQCFGWRPHDLRENEYVGVLGARVVAIRQTTECTQYRALHGGDTELGAKLQDYFQLSTALKPLYDFWASAGCSRMAAITQCLPGLRILRQDPAECLISFICSSNNNVPRITLILDRLREKYGVALCDKEALDCDLGPADLADSTGPVASPSPARNKLMPRLSVSRRWYSFPSIERLSEVPEQEYRDIGLGYRAKFVRNTALKLVAAAEREGAADGSAYLNSLRMRSREDVMSILLGFDGVGQKVADCVALFSLDQVGTVPCDAHGASRWTGDRCACTETCLCVALAVWRIACRDYDPSLSDCKSLTPTVYGRVGDLFRERFGKHAVS
jgi:N-glycosylase/DNA lyase